MVPIGEVVLPVTVDMSGYISSAIAAFAVILSVVIAGWLVFKFVRASLKWANTFDSEIGPYKPTEYDGFESVDFNLPYSENCKNHGGSLPSVFKKEDFPERSLYDFPDPSFHSRNK